jgi:hypothetical protein
MLDFSKEVRGVIDVQIRQAKKCDECTHGHRGFGASVRPSTHALLHPNELQPTEGDVCLQLSSDTYVP